MKVVDLLDAALLAAGVGAVYGPPLPGLGRLGVAVDEPHLAALLAAADEAVHGAPAAVHLGDQVLRFGSGDPVDRLVVESPGELNEAIRTAVARRAASPRQATAVQLGVDVAADAGAVPPPLPQATTPWLPVDHALVDALAGAASLLFLVGPGVLRDRAEDGLRTLAAVTSAGVLNTWGAKGVFYWQSRHHLATIGLQADDYRLSGLADVELIVTSGLDAVEAPRHRWDVAPAVDVAPRMLAPLSERVTRPYRDIELPPIRTRLAAATALGWEATGPHPAPSALTRQYSQLVGAGGLVASEPGRAGFFVARTLPTEAPRTVCVPADPVGDGFAVAACLAARLRTPTRRTLAVLDGPPEERTAALLELAARLGTPVVVEAWTDDGPPVALDDHLAGTAAALIGPGSAVREVAVDGAQLDAFVDAAGPIVAWTEAG